MTITTARGRTVTLNQGWLYGTAALIAILAALAALTGCSQKFLEPFRAAPTAGHDATSSRVLAQPDGFSNAAEKCDGFWHLIITTYHGDRAYAAVAVINDARCGSLTARLPFGR